MAEQTGIEWTDSTFNPWIGCTKVGPGCDHCYAEARMDTRLHVVGWGAGQPRKRTTAKYWQGPKAWNAAHAEFHATHGRRQRVFCSSLADVFDNEVPIEWLVDLLELIRSTPKLDWLQLTKRVGNVTKRLNAALDASNSIFLREWIAEWLNGSPPSHVCVTREKPVENRSWYTGHRGLLLLHAGLSRQWLAPGDIERHEQIGKPLVFGAIIGVARLADCQPAGLIKAGDFDDRYPGLSKNPHVSGPYCFILAEPHAFAEPIPYKGRQGFFDVPYGVVGRQMELMYASRKEVVE